MVEFGSTFFKAKNAITRDEGEHREERVSLPALCITPINAPLREPFPAALLFETASFLPRWREKLVLPTDIIVVYYPPLLSTYFIVVLLRVEVSFPSISYDPSVNI